MIPGLLDVADRVWPVLLFLALIQVVADLCDEAGLFDVGAHVAARLARGSTLLLFLQFTALATMSTWVLSIDTTAVLLTPIGLALAAELGLSALPFAFASIWLANTTSLLLPVSNLTNLLAQERLDLGAGSFMHATWAPQTAVLVVVLLVLLVRHRRALHGRYVVPRGLPPFDPVMLWVSVGVVLLIGPAILVGVPAWAVAAAAAAVLVAGFVVRSPQHVSLRRLWGLLPWPILFFAVVLFALVEILQVEGSPVLRPLFGAGESLGDLAQLAGVTTVLSNVANNLPAYLVAEHFADSTSRLVAVLVGANVGPLVLLWGSLANLLWLRACRDRGLRISAAQFAREGLLVVPLAVGAGVVAAWLT